MQLTHLLWLCLGFVLTAAQTTTANPAPGTGVSLVTVDNVQIVVIIALVIGVCALLYAGVLAWLLVQKPTGTAAMVRIAASIEEGAGAYLKREYLALSCFAVVAAGVVAGVNYNTGPGGTLACFLTGATLSALCGWFGMKIAVKANVRTTAAAMDPQNGLSAALRVAFNSGTVMGMSVVGFGLTGISALVLIIHAAGTDISTRPIVTGEAGATVWDMLAGFAMGASSIALFARVGGGIYTKAADVGADLVGKVEAGIPEDDPRNPGVIADNVGDNVGDVAGMGADLYESYCGSIIAAATLGNSLRFDTSTGGLTEGDYQAVALPFIVAGLGIVCSFIGGLAVRTGEGASQNRLLWSMRTGVAVASALHIIAMGVVNWGILNIRTEYTVCIYIGLVCGVLIGYFTEYATSFAYKPTQGIARAGVTGPATVIIQGLGVGQLSTVPPVLTVCATIVACMYLGRVYGVSIAAVGMLATLGVTLSTDAYGPVADNAGGIAEMAELDASVRERTDALDALGNTTAATGKGFAIGSAVLTALALMGAFADRIDGLKDVKLISNGTDSSIFVVPGIIFGTMLPFLFSALTMLAVGKSATAIIQEVRRQFREIPGLMEGTADADYARCVAISTSAALREMVMPGFLAIVCPFIVGLGLGPEALLGLLIGAIASGFLLAVMMANAGGAWDNSKKWVESGESGLGGKGTDIHAAVVTGDTVGDPFKDTSGPSINIQIKISAIVALVAAPAFRNTASNWWVSLLVLLAAILFIIGWSYYLRSTETVLDFQAGQSAVPQAGADEGRHRGRGGRPSRHGRSGRHGRPRYH